MNDFKGLKFYISYVVWPPGSMEFMFDDENEAALFAKMVGGSVVVRYNRFDTAVDAKAFYDEYHKTK